MTDNDEAIMLNNVVEDNTVKLPQKAVTIYLRFVRPCDAVYMYIAFTLCSLRLVPTIVKQLLETVDG